jgi:hypothetical protein
MTLHKVYVDTCIFSKIIDDTFNDDSLYALEAICDNTSIILQASDKVLEEINNTKDKRTKIRLKVIYKLISKIQRMETKILKDGFSFPLQFPFIFGHYEEDPFYSDIKEIFTEHDAEQIFNASKERCDFFLTEDKKTILSRKEKWKKYLQSNTDLCDLKLVNCLELGDFLKKKS